MYILLIGGDALIKSVLCITVVIRNVLQLSNQSAVSVLLPKLVTVIQQARRILAYESVTKELEYTDDPNNQRADRQTTLEVDKRMDQLQEAISLFK